MNDFLISSNLARSVFGRGLLGSMRHAAHLVQPNARVIPERLRIHAVLGELLLNDVDGFDLSLMNAYRWHPSHQPVQLDR